MVDEVEEKSAIDNDDVLSRFGKALQFGLDQPLERIADTFKVFGFTDTEKFLRDLTEEPENEAPVAIALVDRYKERQSIVEIAALPYMPKDPCIYERSVTREVNNIGSQNLPVVISDFRYGM